MELDSTSSPVPDNDDMKSAQETGALNMALVPFQSEAKEESNSSVNPNDPNSEPNSGTEWVFTLLVLK